MASSADETGSGRVNAFSDYRGKRVVVTGCFSGMGEATARMLLELGAEVHGLDYKDCMLPLASFTRMDLRDQDEIDAAIDGIGGRIDRLFNCAGLSIAAPPLDIFLVNFVGTRHLTERAVARMEPGGAIASIASRGGAGWARRMPLLTGLLATSSFEEAIDWYDARKEQVPDFYSLSKEAIIVWTMGNAELLERGIRINCTMPGATQTPMTADFEAVTPPDMAKKLLQPSGRRSAPCEQAGPLLFLNSDLASYVNGVALPVDGGFLAGMTLEQLAPADGMAGS